MRYYRYGSDRTKHDVEMNMQKQQGGPGCFGELVIDEDTIYEIDKDCVRCREKESGK